MDQAEKVFEQKFKWFWVSGALTIAFSAFIDYKHPESFVLNLIPRFLSGIIFVVAGIGSIQYTDLFLDRMENISSLVPFRFKKLEKKERGFFRLMLKFMGAIFVLAGLLMLYQSIAGYFLGSVPFLQSMGMAGIWENS